MKRSVSWLASFFLCFALVAGIALEPASSGTHSFDKLRNSLQFGGYYEFEYTDVEAGNGSSPNGSFDQHRNILFFGAQPHERIKFFNELEIEHGGHPDIKFEQAWLEFALNDNHNFRAGIDLIPLGRLNLEHDGNLRDFVLRPRVDSQLIPTTWFESGLEFNGNLSNNVSYQVGVSNGINSSPATDTGTRSEFESMLTSDLDETDRSGSKAVWGRVAFTPALGTEIGVSGYQTDYNGVDSIDFLALDFNHTRGPWEFKGEWVTIDKDQQGTGLKGADGGYLEAAYHFFPKGWYDSWLARGFDNPTFTALARAEDLNFDEASAGPNPGDYNVYSLGFNYRPMERMAFKAQYDIDDESLSGIEDQNKVSFGMVLGY